MTNTSSKPQNQSLCTRRREPFLISLILAAAFISANTVRANSGSTYQFTLFWTNSDTSVDANTIERSLDGINFALIAQLAPTPASYTDSGRQAATVYYYRMRSHNAAGDSAYSSVVVGSTPPALTIDNHTDYQMVANANAALAGTASGVNGIQSVTVNGQAAVLSGNNWSAGMTLVAGTNTIVMIASDESPSHNSTTQTVHVVFSTSNNQPRILSAPAVTNALALVGNIAVVVAGEPVAFIVQAEDPLGAPLNYEWHFGDGQTNTGIGPLNIYTDTNCQGYAVSVVINNGTASTTGTVHVATACALDVVKLEMLASFTSTNADRVTLTANVAPGPGFSPKGQTVALDIGDAQVAFLLNARGTDVSKDGRVKLLFNKKTGLWILTAKLKNGNWHDQWAAYGLVAGPLATTTTVTVPAIVVVGMEAFAAQPQLPYSATTSESGTARTFGH